MTAPQQHKSAAQTITPRCAVITLSDSRTPATDTSGQLIRKLLEEDGCVVARQELIRDEPQELKQLVELFLSSPDIDTILTTGGTGISRRDATVKVIDDLIDNPLPGFGELFRMLSFDQVGSAAMLSRATGGIARGKILFAMPGSSKAVELAMTRLVLPELRHLIWELTR